MPLIEGRCKNCNGEIKFDSSRDKGFCSFCGTPFLREDLIINQHYHNDFSGANVILNDLESIEKQLENAENNLTRLKDYDRAETIYRNITQKASGEYRAWWGLVRSISREFTDVSLSRYDEIEMYTSNTLKVVDNVRIRNDLIKQWEKYKSFLGSCIDEKINSLNDEKNELITKRDSINCDINKKQNLVYKCDEIARKSDVIMIICIVIAAFGCGAVIILGMKSFSDFYNKWYDFETMFYNSILVITSMLTVSSFILSYMCNGKRKSKLKEKDKLISEIKSKETEINLELNVKIIEIDSKIEKLNVEKERLKSKIKV